MPPDVLKNTMEFSDSVVAAILRWSKKDNYAQTRTAERYTVLYDVTGRWIPTPPMYGTAVEPHWNEIRTMVIDSLHNSDQYHLQFVIPKIKTAIIVRH